MAQNSSPITYRQLLEKLNTFPEEKLNLHAVVYVSDMDEYFSLGSVDTGKDYTDVLDPEHPYLTTLDYCD